MVGDCEKLKTKLQEVKEAIRETAKAEEEHEDTQPLQPVPVSTVPHIKCTAVEETELVQQQLMSHRTSRQVLLRPRLHSHPRRHSLGAVLSSVPRFVGLVDACM